MPSIGSEQSEAAFEAYMRENALKKAERASGARAEGGELIDARNSNEKPSTARLDATQNDLPKDVGISGEYTPPAKEHTATLATLEKSQSFLVALSKLEGMLLNLNGKLSKGAMNKNTLGGELSRFNDQMRTVEEMMRSAGAKKTDIDARLSSHEAQYSKWYNLWETMN